MRSYVASTVIFIYSVNASAEADILHLSLNEFDKKNHHIFKICLYIIQNFQLASKLILSCPEYPKICESCGWASPVTSVWRITQFSKPLARFRGEIPGNGFKPPELKILATSLLGFVKEAK